MRLSREKINRIAKLIIDDFDNRDELDYLEEPNETRLHIVKVITNALKIEDEIDGVVRKKLQSYAKNIWEGSSEWDVLYEKHFKEEMGKRGVFADP